MTEIILKSNMARDKINALLLFLKTWDEKIQVSVHNDEPYSAEAEEKINEKKKTIADFFGTISEDTYQKLKKHTEQARQEWDRNI